MEKIILEGVVECEKEDGGRALIAQIESENEEDDVFVRIQSWSDDRTHTVMNSIQGKKVRVTIEVID